VSARQGLNRVTWTPRLAAPFTIPPRIVMWGGGGGGPKAAPGAYTVKVTSGSWSHGALVKQLYDTLGQLREVKKQADEISKKAGPKSPLAEVAKGLLDKLVAVEGEITQLQGEGGQDALNYPGRLDNQCGSLANQERKLNRSITERHTDLKPPTDALMKRAATVLKDDVATFNAVAAKAGVVGIVVK
jgi:hypothetical protein